MSPLSGGMAFLREDFLLLFFTPRIKLKHPFLSSLAPRRRRSPSFFFGQLFCSSDMKRSRFSRPGRRDFVLFLSFSSGEMHLFFKVQVELSLRHL